MQRYRALLFDLDGTLVDSSAQLTAGVNALMAGLRLRPFSEEEVKVMIGKGVRVLLERVCTARGIFATGQTIDTMQKLYSRCVREGGAPQPQFYPGVRQALDEVRGAGLAVALVTNKNREMTGDFLDKAGCGALFDAIVTGDDTAHPKPAPDMLELACRRLGCGKQECLMVGDSKNDALAARAAGMDVALVQTGYNEGEPIGLWARNNGFEAIFPSAAEVCARVLAAR